MSSSPRHDSGAPHRLRAIRTQRGENAFWLVLSEPDDPSAAWLSDGLREQSRQPVMHLTSRDLAQTARAERGVDDEGVWFSMSTADGRTVHSRRLLGVVYRLASPFAKGRSATMGVGRRIAGGTMGAPQPLVRWLQTWPGPVLNRPVPHGPNCELFPAAWWVDRAITAGFAAPESRGAADEEPEPASEVVVIDDLVFPVATPGGTVSQSLEWRSLRLARGVSASILGITVSRTATGSWRFSSASVLPDLRVCGERGIQAVAKALRHRSGATDYATGGSGLFPEV